MEWETKSTLGLVDLANQLAHITHALPRSKTAKSQDIGKEIVASLSTSATLNLLPAFPRSSLSPVMRLQRSTGPFFNAF